MKDRKNVEKVRGILRCELEISMAHKCINKQNFMKSNEHWRIFQWVLSFKNKNILKLGICMCEGVGQDSGYGHEESHLIHDMKYSMKDYIFCTECGMMCVCHCMCI